MGEQSYHIKRPLPPSHTYSKTIHTCARMFRALELILSSLIAAVSGCIRSAAQFHIMLANAFIALPVKHCCTSVECCSVYLTSGRVTKVRRCCFSGQTHSRTAQGLHRENDRIPAEHDGRRASTTNKHALQQLAHPYYSIASPFHD